MAVDFSLYKYINVATKDFSLRMDCTEEWAWITNEGRFQMIRISTYLWKEESISIVRIISIENKIIPKENFFLKLE